MAQQTQIDIPAFQEIIRKHEEVQNRIQQRRQNATEEVNLVKAGNSGDMVNSLVAAHDQWDLRMKDIAEVNLTAMIDAMNTTLSKLQQQDSANRIA
ncbi:hypothetical protein [Amycolatopsis sp. NPDC049868]|uniref:hypothetical protein n=1 Tax=Amycolatopsis sp. NPDC049868 TaxID=3363934 RepID=UPI00379C82F5